MKLYEYQAKTIFDRYGIPIPKGRIALNPEIADHIYEELKSDVVIKAQVLASGRGKAGGIRLAKTSKQVEEIANDILGLTIKGLPVKRILVEEAIKFQDEYFLAIISDKNAEVPSLIASKYGGVDIESSGDEDEEFLFTIPIDPLIGLQEYQIRSAALAIELPKLLWDDFDKITLKMWNMYQEVDADLVEINPLVISDSSKLIALDAKIIIDDNAIYRHHELTEFFDLEGDDKVEYQARKHGLAYIKLEGNIGCMVNGAGLAMATLDLLEENGGKAANFLDIGGGANAEKVSSGLKILLADQNIKVIMINIFGGITRCDEVARGLLAVLENKEITIPIVTRLSGTNAEEGQALLKSSEMISVDSITEAVKICVKIAGEKKK